MVASSPPFAARQGKHKFWLRQVLISSARSVDPPITSFQFQFQAFPSNPQQTHETLKKNQPQFGSRWGCEKA